jgi:flagellar motor switch protein FliG
MPVDAVKSGKLTGRKKAAILVITLGPELSAEIFKQLTEEEIEILTYEVANIRNVTAEEKDKVIDEFYEMMGVQQYMAEGGLNMANEMLIRSLGQEKAMSLMKKLTSKIQIKPLDVVRSTDPAQLVNFIQEEHPQTIALIMAYLKPEQAAFILQSLPENIQPEVARRLALMDRTSPEVLRDMEKVLEKKVLTISREDYTSAGGVDSLVQLLINSDRSTEKRILESLELQDPELAEEVKQKMFVFEDIVILQDRDVQQVLRSLDIKELAKALKLASEEVKEKFFRNLSKNARRNLQEEIEYLGPMRKRDVEEAQQHIVNIIRKLEESGEITIARNEEEIIE